MLESLNNTWKQLQASIAKLTRIQLIALGALVLIVVFALIFLFSFSTSPVRVPLFGVAIRDENTLGRIVQRLDEEGYNYTLSNEGYIYFGNKELARRARTVLIRENLVPTNVDPWSLFDMDRWTLTDFERNVNFRRSLTRELEQHIAAIEGVDAASIMISLPENDSLFAEDRQPTTVSVRITETPGSDLSSNRKKIQGMESLVLKAVPGVKSEDITIVNGMGMILNDFSGLEDFDRLSLAERQRKLKSSLERQVRADIEMALAGVLPSRFEIARLSVNMDASRRTISATEYSPVEITPQNPKVNYNTREVRTDLLISSETSNKEYEGQGFSPWGPPGQEGQTPPEYQNVADLVGKYNEGTQRNNYALNERRIEEEKSPIEINSVSVAVFVDGTWRFEYDEKGRFIVENGSRKRVFTPASDEEILAVSRILETALKAESKEGSISVDVQRIQFSRQAQFEREDKDYWEQKLIENLIIWGSIAVVAILILFMVARYLAREAERRNRMRQEELARQAQLQQQQAIIDARNMGFDDVMSLEERESSELKEYATSLSKEQPDEVAQLIRTWLAEGGNNG